MGKSTQIKQVIAKIDINKIANYRQEYSRSKTLRQLINCFQRIQTSNDDQEIFRLGTRIAYYLDVICDPDKANYVKDEKEKKHWLEVSRELFENTIGVKKKKT
jgi:hypothetical protein